MKKMTVIAASVVVVVGLSACQPNQLNDAPVGNIDDSPTLVLTNVDGFPNISFRCHGVNGIYTTTRDAAGAITIVANDPECGGDPEFTAVSG